MSIDRPISIVMIDAIERVLNVANLYLASWYLALWQLLFVSIQRTTGNNISCKVAECHLYYISSSSFFLFPTLNGVGTACFSPCCDKDSAIIFTPGPLPDFNPP
jgi:hypothetical protein